MVTFRSRASIRRKLEGTFGRGDELPCICAETELVHFMLSLRNDPRRGRTEKVAKSKLVNRWAFGTFTWRCTVLERPALLLSATPSPKRSGGIARTKNRSGVARIRTASPWVRSSLAVEVRSDISVELVSRLLPRCYAKKIK